MLPALATLPDLEARLGGPVVGATEIARATALLADSSTLVRSVADETWTDAAGDLVGSVPDAVVMVTLAAAKRAFENPTGIVQKTAGDISLSFGGRSDSALFLTEAEAKMVRRAVGRNGLFGLRTTRGEPIIDRFGDPGTVLW